MTVSDLEKKLTEIADDFSAQIRPEYSEGSKKPVAEEDIAILAKQVFNALNSYKTEIVKYLKQSE